MTLALVLPPCPASPLARLDPRWRLAGLLFAALAAALLQTLPAAGLALAGSCLLVVLARIPWFWYAPRIGLLALALAVFVLPLPLLLDGPGPAWRWGWLKLTWHGAAVALVLAGKALTIVNLMLVLLTAGPLDATLKAARSLGVPGLLVQLALMTYRYLFLLADELGRMRVALRVRGFRNRPDRHSYRLIGHLAGILLVRGSDRAERVSQAMRCRGFDGQFRSLTDCRTHCADVLFLVLLVLAGVGLCWLDRLGS